MPTVTDEDFDKGPGGFWIRADGTLVYVTQTSGSAILHTVSHYSAAVRDGTEGYTSSYRGGRIRVSTHYGDELNVNLMPETVTVSALQALSSIIRHGRSDGREFRLELEGPVPADSKKYQYFKADERSKFANTIMQMALERNALAKQAEAEAPAA